MKFIKIGKIVNTHGIKGELRIISDFKYKDKVFVKDFNIYIGPDKIKEKITSYRKHKQFDMICLASYNSINEVLKYKGLYVFIDKSDLKLAPNSYLNEDIIGLDVIVLNNNIGKITDVIKNVKGELLVINNKILVPYYDVFVKKIDIDNNKIYLNYIDGLFD